MSKFRPDAFMEGRQCCKPGSPEGNYLDVTEAGLLLVFRHPYNPSTAWNVRQGDYQFRAIAIDEVIFFLAKFGTMPWQAIPFHIGQAQHKDPELPNSRQGLPVHVFYADSETGILKAKRQVFLSRTLSRKLICLFQAQEKTPPLNWDIRVRKARRKYSLHQMVALSAMQN